MPLSHDEMNILRALSEPIDQGRRADFIQEVARQLEATPAVGPGTAYQIGRVVQRDFWDPPADLRHSRVRASRSSELSRAGRLSRLAPGPAPRGRRLMNGRQRAALGRQQSAS